MNKIKQSKFFQLSKLGLPSLVLVMVLATVLFSVLNPKNISGSVYNITDLERKIDSVKTGDYINYNINGYSNWKVLSKNEHNGTIDIVSDTNVKDITFDYRNSPSAQETLQEAADEYKDNRYAISARPVSEEDAGKIAYDGDFWLLPKTDYVIGSTKGDINLEKLDNGKVFVLPYLEVKVSDSEYEDYARQKTNLPEEGYIYNHTINGISEWLVIGDSSRAKTFIVIPKRALEIEVTSVDDIIDDKVNALFSTFSNIEEVSEIGYVNRDTSISGAKEYAKKSVEEETGKVHVITSKNNYKHNDSYMWNSSEGGMYTFNSKSYEDVNIIYRNPDYYEREKLGFRPVVTIKYGQGKEGKDIDNSKLKVGDYVKYSAKSYNSWRVLSIDEDEGYIEIISSGCVKNITLNGKSGYEEAIELLQNEANQYLAGENAISARIVDENDSEKLYAMDNNSQNIGIYWTGIKRERTASNSRTKYYTIGTYDSSFVSTAGPLLKENYINLYIQDNKGNDESFMYTAGLRPIIKIKLKDAQKIDPSDCKKCEKTINIYNKLIIKEQQLKNEEYNKRFYGNAEKDYTSSTETNNYYNNNSYVNNTKNVKCDSGNCCKDNWILLMVIIVIGVITCILVSILTINSTLILKNMKNNK